MDVQCFLVEPTTTFQRALRRFTWCNTGHDCASGYHNVCVNTEDRKELLQQPYDGISDDCWPRDDPRWPKQCTCGYVFKPEDPWQHHLKRLFRRADSGLLLPISEMPVGAMYWAAWHPDKGWDGRHLQVKVPDEAGGHWWSPDSRANNCDRKEDKEHRCWCRHGEPPNVTVDKVPEPGHTTCGAGAGSIGNKGWHGFLRGGKLVEA